MSIRRKPGEPIYLRRHMLALLLAVLAPLVIPRLYELAVGPLSFAGRLASGVVIAAAAGLWLYFLFRDSARNEP